MTTPDSAEAVNVPTAPSPATEGTASKEQDDRILAYAKKQLPVTDDGIALLCLAEQLTAARHQAEQLEATVAELRRQSEADKALIEQLQADFNQTSANNLEFYHQKQEAQRQLASADGDRKRLDWADKNMPYILRSIDLNGRPYYSVMNPFNDGWRTLRAAIDAAMSIPPTTKEGKGEA